MSEARLFKIMALFLAIFVWYLAKQGTKTVDLSFFAPVVFKSLPSHLIITSDPPSLVNVFAQTIIRHGDIFKPNEVQVVVDLKNMIAGTYPYTLSKENVLAPKEIEILNISPSQITITTEELVQKKLQIQPRYHGQLRNGYILQKIEILPSEITVEGPSSILAEEESIFTREIDLEDLNSSIDLVVFLDLASKLKIIDKDVDFYTARISVKSLPLKKNFDKIPIYLRNTMYVSVINPKTFNLVLEGPADLINGLESSQLYGIVDLADYKPGNYKVTPNPIVPKETDILQQWPTIRLWVKEQTLPEENRTQQLSQ